MVELSLELAQLKHGRILHRTSKSVHLCDGSEDIPSLSVAAVHTLCRTWHYLNSQYYIQDISCYAFNISLCRRARSREGCIFMSWNSLMAKSRCSRASFFSPG